VSAEASDEELVARANRGDTAAFEALYRRHREWVLALALRHARDREEALDVLQDTFATFLARFPGFRLTGTVRGYLYPVVTHRCVSLARKRRKVVPLRPEMERGVSESPDASEPPGDFARLVDGLPEGQREVVRLRFALGMKLQEIAEALDLPLGTVKSRLHHALATLRERHRELR
jgi:RNA polymerase sigma-70 factor (ECF subfamily)